MTLKNGDVRQSIEKLKEYIGQLAKNTTRDFNKIFLIVQEYPLISISFIFAVIFLLLGSAEGHEYPDLQVGDEVDPRLFLIPIKIYNIDPL